MLKLLTQSCVKTNFKSPPLSRISRIISRNFQTDRRDFDIVIVGGGIIGRTLASCLVSSKFTDQLKIALIDNAYKPNSKVEREQIFDLRTVAISPTTKEVFNRIGVWDRISPFANMYDEMIVWDSKGNASMHFKEKEGLGYIISNTLLTNALIEKLENSNIQIIPDNLKKFSLYPHSKYSPEITKWENEVSGEQFQDDVDIATLSLASGGSIRSKLIIGADGGNSFTRNHLHIPVRMYEYGQKAVVGTVKTDRAHHIAYQRFLSNGLIAMLPVGDGNSSNIVWSTSSEHADWLLSLDSDKFIKAINHAFCGDVDNKGNYVVMNEFIGNGPEPPKCLELHNNAKAAFPLRRIHAREYVRHRFALVGDAAHSTHVLAGQGVNLGIVDIVTLVKTIQDSIKTGQDIGDVNMLKKYERKQYMRNELAMAVMDTLKVLYDCKITPLSIARQFGVSLLNNLEFAKKFIQNQAMGKDVNVHHIRKK